MGSVQLWNGRPLISGGKLAIDPACCCEGVCPEFCTDCPELQFEISGFGMSYDPDRCGPEGCDCTVFNISDTLTKNGCFFGYWALLDFPGYGANAVSAQIHCEDGKWVARYIVNFSTWQAVIGIASETGENACPPTGTFTLTNTFEYDPIDPCYAWPEVTITISGQE